LNLVRFTAGLGCRVLSEKWEDPYTGKTLTNPRKLDFDHYIPLKKALDSGAWPWDHSKKKQFAIYLINENH
jgi:hypothetical protein